MARLVKTPEKSRLALFNKNFDLTKMFNLNQTCKNLELVLFPNYCLYSS